MTIVTILMKDKKSQTANTVKEGTESTFDKLKAQEQKKSF